MEGMNVVFVPMDRLKYMNRIGVDSDGNPVVYNPQKAREKNKRPNYILKPETAEDTEIPADIKKEQVRRIAELLEKNGKIDPSKDKVFYNPQTGELDTIKPGLICPKHDGSNAKKGAIIGGLLGLGVTGALAFVFRKPIGNILSLAAGVLKTAAGSISDTFKNVLGKIKK